jgi:periplasmic protein TonB
MLAQKKLALMVLLINCLAHEASAEQNPTNAKAPQASEIVTISPRVATGLLVEKKSPTYPPAARAKHVSGTVVVQVTITETGTVEHLSVKSGPAMLQQAALDAVKSYRYRPYLIHYKPVQALTTVNVVFNSQCCL